MENLSGERGEIMGKYVKLLILSILICAVAAGSVSAQEKVAVLNLQAYDGQGNLMDPVAVGKADLVSISRIVALGVTSRLVQYGQFEVLDEITLYEKVLAADIDLAQLSPYEQADLLLRQYQIDQVITGSIAMLQNTVVIGVQRFMLVDGETSLVGSAMVDAAKATDTPAQIDNLLNYLYPADIQVVERPIDQVFLSPNQIRLNLGASHQIVAYALDNLGRPIADPDYLYVSSDEAKVIVNEKGVLTGLQPGTATITVRGISGTTRSGPPATMTVTVVPPTLGFRIGTLLTQREGIEGRPISLGLRLTPSLEQSQPKTSQSQTQTSPAALASEPSNPLTMISTLFSSLLTNGLMTIDVDFEPTREMMFAFNGVQRSSTGYIGTGVGYIFPLDSVDGSSYSAFALRFTMGTQLRATNRLSVPSEVVIDMIFPTSGTVKPSFRIGVNAGFDLFP